MGGQLDVVGWEQRKGSGELAAAVHLCRFYFLFPVCMSVSIVFSFPSVWCRRRWDALKSNNIKHPDIVLRTMIFQTSAWSFISGVFFSYLLRIRAVSREACCAHMR